MSKFVAQLSAIVPFDSCFSLFILSCGRAPSQVFSPFFQKNHLAGAAETHELQLKRRFCPICSQLTNTTLFGSCLFVFPLFPVFPQMPVKRALT
jgi:hypothetical protein